MKNLPLIFLLLISQIPFFSSFSQSKIVLKDKTVVKDVKIWHIYFNKIEYEEKGSLHDLSNANIERIETDTAILTFDENGNTLSRPYDYIVKTTNDTIFCLISQLGGNYIYYYPKGKDNRSYISTSSLKDYKKFEPQPLGKQEEKPQQTIAQTSPETPKNKKDTAVQATPENADEPLVFTMVEEMPAFPGGEQELFKYLSQNIKYPAMAKDAGISGIVYVTFVVMEDGQINDVKVLRGIGGGCDEEATRVVKSMPQWKAGKQKGKPVRVQFNLPIRFTLKGNETTSKKETTENAPVSVGVDGKKIVEVKREPVYEEQYEESNEESENNELLRQSIKNDLCYESYMKGVQDASQKDQILWAVGGFCASGCGFTFPALTYWAQDKDDPVTNVPEGVVEKCYILGYQNQKRENRVQNVAIGGMAAAVIVVGIFFYTVFAGL